MDVLRRETGERETEVEASTLREALSGLAAKYGERFKEKIYDKGGNIRRFINIHVDGEDTRFLDHLDTTLKHEDEVLIISAVGGG
jgi:molybdopterin converting factor small subunit